MEIFKGRPLALTALLFAVCAAATSASGSVWPAAALAVCAAFVSAAVLVRRRRRRGGRYHTMTVLLVSLLSALFCLRCAFFFVFDRAAALKYCSDSADVCGVVEERVFSSNFAVSYDVRIVFIDKNGCDIKGRLECSFSCPMQDGDLFLIRGAEISDSAGSSPSLPREGRYLTVSCGDSYSVTVTGKSGTVASTDRLAGRLSYLIRSKIGGREGGLCAAMLLGDRSYLDPDISLDFRRAGVSHLLAVSGLHMSMLTGFVSAFLSKIRLKKRFRAPVLCGFVIIYAALLGFPVSATRSALMLLVSYTCLTCGFDSDGVSSLGLAVCLILAARPGAIADIGFILSVGGTLGLLAAMPALRPLERRRDGEKGRGQGIIRRAAFAAARAVLAVVSANMLTTLPVALCFGEISKASVPSNLAFPPLAGVLLFLSLMLLLTLPIPFVSDMIAFYARKTAGLLISGAGRISDIDGVSVSLRAPLTLAVLVAAAALTVIFLTVRLRRRIVVVLPYLCALLAIVCLGGAFAPSGIGCVSLSVGNGEAFCAVGGGKAVIIDMSAGNYAPLSSAASAAESLGATETAALVLTHYHVRHVGTVSRFVSEHKVRGLYIPEPQTKKDASVALSVIDAASQCGIPVYEYTSFENIDVFGGVTLSLSGPFRIDRSTHPVLSFILERGNERIIWFGRSSWESFEILSYLRIDDGTTLIAGRHGPVIKTPCAFDLRNAGRIMTYSRDQLYELTAGKVPASELFDIPSTDVGVYPSGVFVEIGG